MADHLPRYQRFFAELKRRRVFRVMAFYGAASFAVLQAVDLLVPVLGLPDSVIQGVASLLLFGAPVAILLEWAFEITPDGLRRTSDATPGELTRIITAPASKRWPSGLLALAGMTALLAGAWYIGRKSVSPDGAAQPEASAPSIAVLPFVNMSSDPEQEFFSDGISEELLNLLAKIPELRVASRASAFSFKGQDLGIQEIAGRLNVAHVLGGSVRKAEGEVRITAQLVDARTDTNLWSRSWDRTLEDVFAVQDEIAAEVVKQLEVSLLGGIPTVEATDGEAYALFLQGRLLGRQRTAEGFRRSIEVLEQALRIEPDYVAAWGELARVYATQAGSGDRSAEEAFQAAREAAGRALEIDPEYAPAIAHLGLIAMAHDRDLFTAAEYYQEALALSPTDTDIIGDAATLLQSLGRLEEAIALKEYVVARDPVSPRGHHNLGNSYRWAARWDEAVASYETAESLSPGYIGARTGMGQALLGKGDPEAALETILMEPSRPWELIGLTMAYSALGRQEESDQALAELIGGWERDAAYNIAYVLAFRGEADRAFEMLSKAVEYNDPGLSEIVVENGFDNIKGDPRWPPLLESIGKGPSQLADIQFRVTVPE
ncbi:MAG: tetratricopeptide repeat protein [Gemmatimonadetes bacterium]|nr:tetratricopeptide repeat protein [Gemmatimonadota bacterium]NNM06593.1 tetratricopeptide repeat protein [Gemmatimonadota bacterium]